MYRNLIILAADEFQAFIGQAIEMARELTLDPTDPLFLNDKYAYIEQLREQNFYARSDDGVVFLNQQDAIYVMRCIDFQFSFFQINPQTSAYLSASIEHELLNKHGDDHRRLQKLVMSALRDQIVEGFSEIILKMVNDLIDAMPDKGVVDLCKVFADPIPARVLSPMLGIPYEDIPEFNEWIRIGGRKADALSSGDGIKEVEDANRKMHNYVREMLRERSDKPGNDVFSELIAAEIDGDRLSEDELVSLASELAAAGVETTRAQLPLILYELLKHPDQFTLLQNHPGLAAATVEEGMRYAPLPFTLPHAALRDHEYRGIRFKQGDLALVLVPAANRDPRVIDNPQVFDINRMQKGGSARHFSFGYGPHFCTGAQLARIEMSIALEALARRIRSWQLLEEPPRDPVTKGSTPTQLLVEIEKH